MRRAVVTGASGFIGGALTRELRERGYKVATLTRSPDPRDPDNLVLGAAPWSVEAWANALRHTRPDVVFHLAGAARGSEADLEAANVTGTETLFSAMRACDIVAPIVLAGSAAEYGAAIQDGVPVREEDRCEPAAPYGRSKLAQTRLALAFAEETEIPVCIARIFNAIGPGLPRHLALGDFAAQIVAMAPEQNELATGNLDVARDFVTGEQAALSLRKLGEISHTGIVNVCSGYAVSLRAMVERMIEASGRDIRLTLDPARLRPGDLRAIIGSKEKLDALGASAPDIDLIEIAPAILRHAAARNGAGFARAV